MIRAEALEAAGGKIDTSPVSQSVAVPTSMRRPWRMYFWFLVAAAVVIAIGWRVVSGGVAKVLGRDPSVASVARAVGPTSRPAQPSGSSSVASALGLRNGGGDNEPEIRVLSVGSRVARVTLAGEEFEVVEGDIIGGVRVSVDTRGLWWGQRYIPCSVPKGSNQRLKAVNNGAGSKSSLP